MSKSPTEPPHSSNTNNQDAQGEIRELGCILGETEASVVCTDIYKLKTHCLSMATQARRSLTLFTQELEPELFDNKAFSHAIHHLAKAHRYNRIRILTHDYRKAEKNGHALGAITEKLPSFVSMRETPSTEKNIAESYLIADQTGLILREVASTRSFNAQIHYKAPRLVKNKLQHFNDLWERSTPVRAFRALLM